MPLLSDIAKAIEEVAPLSAQEEWDNSGWQVAIFGTDIDCTGVMLCLDVTPEVVSEAEIRGCNLIVSHHPLIFKGVRSLCSENRTEQAIIHCIRAGISVYSAHTSLDTAPCGPSARLASMLGLTDCTTLSESSGLGIIGTLPKASDVMSFVQKAGEVYGGGLRVSDGSDDRVERVALCSGAGAEFISTAIARGADTFITSDIRYHDFVNFGRRILLIDVGHFESEICTKSIFSDIISEKFPNFAPCMCSHELPPVAYHVHINSAQHK
ncbi:MAG: Nif3-like dinuclear metal center hexameric protein [Duncaniella sp.]|nr:Nif3-like dinuclear metal center hexameric protein [Duncaniella sp.]